jgi:pimeloyl-ACP methyl ester carboxylesterase
MARLSGPGGVEIHWEARGKGPVVVISPHCWAVPETFEPLIGELARDHLVIRYDARGTGQSTREGPHDMETGAADLLAVIEATGPPAVVLGIGDAPSRAVRIAAGRPELVRAVVAIASVPIGHPALRGTEALVSSETVVGAFLEMVATDYRGAMRPLLTAANPQMSEDEVKRRLDTLVAYAPQTVVVERLRAWVADDATEPAREMGDRLWLLASPETAGPWFPSPEEIEDVIAELLPDSRREVIEEGIISRPDLTAEVVRRITAPIRAAAPPGRPAAGRRSS